MPVDKFGKMPEYTSDSGVSLAYINKNFLRKGTIDMLGSKITNLGTPTDGSDAAPKSYVVRRVGKLVRDYGLDELENNIKRKLQAKIEVGLKKLREYMKKYVDEEELEVELNKIKDEFAAIGDTTEDKIKQKIQADVQSRLHNLKDHLKKYVDEEELGVVINRTINEAFGNDIDQLKAEVKQLAENRLNILLFSLDIENKGIKVYADSTNKIHIVDSTGNRYNYFTEAFEKTLNIYTDYDSLVEYPHRAGGAFLYAAEHWLLKKLGIYTIDIDMLYTTSNETDKRLFQLDVDGTTKTFHEKEGGGCRERWTFTTIRPNTRASFYNVAHRDFYFQRGHIRLYYRP